MPDGRTTEELVNQKSVAEISQDSSFSDSSLAASITPSCDCLDLEDTLQLFQLWLLEKCCSYRNSPACETCKTKWAKSRFVFYWVWWEFTYFRAEFATWYSRFYRQGISPRCNSDVDLAWEETVTLKRSLLNTRKTFLHTLPHQHAQTLTGTFLH